MFWIFFSLVLLCVVIPWLCWQIYRLARIIFTIEDVLSKALWQTEETITELENLSKAPIIVASKVHEREYQIVINALKKLKIDILLVANEFTKISKKQYEELEAPEYERTEVEAWQQTRRQ